MYSTGYGYRRWRYLIIKDVTYSSFRHHEAHIEAWTKVRAGDVNEVPGMSDSPKVEQQAHIQIEHS